MITCTSSCVVCNISFSVSINVLEMTLYVRKKKRARRKTQNNNLAYVYLKTTNFINLQNMSTFRLGDLDLVYVKRHE